MGDPAGNDDDPRDEFDDDDDGFEGDDERLGALPNRLDRVWLHPAELPPAPKPKRFAPALARAARPLAIGALGALVAVAVLGALGAFADDEPTATSINALGRPGAVESSAPVAKAGDSVVAVTIYDQAGARRVSGVGIRHRGEILTSARALGDAPTVTVTTADGDTFEAVVAGRDATTDLALLTVTSPITAITVADDEPMLGETVWVLGGPTPADGTTWRANGIVATRDATVASDPGPMFSGLFETDVPSSPNSAGGALVNSKGEVAGIVLAPVDGRDTTIAVPIAMAISIAEELREDGIAAHGALGVAGAATPAGPIVTGVDPAGAGAAAGIAVGDVVVALDDRPILDVAELTAVVRWHRPGTAVDVTVLRGDERRHVRVTLGSTAGPVDPAATFVSARATM